MLRWLFPISYFRTSEGQQQLAQEYVLVEVRLLVGTGVNLHVDCCQQLSTVSELVTDQTGVPHSCQTIIVSETRRQSRGFGAAARDLTHSWQARKSTRSLILGLVNYLFLPQVVSREFSGRGLYHWARGGLQLCLREQPQGTVTLQVHMLDGHTLTLDLLADASLRDMQTLVQQETGVLLDRQRIAIEERLPPSKLLQLTNQLLLGSFAGLRAAGHAAFWAQHALRRHLWGKTHFPLTVKTHSGQIVTVDATMDMTVAELHHAVSCHPSTAPTQPASSHPIQEVTFPAIRIPAAKGISKKVQMGLVKSKPQGLNIVT